MTDVRAVPFYCPFCGEQDIRPDDAGDRAWRCESCRRGFELTAITVGEAG
jgi:transposase-like protein